MDFFPGFVAAKKDFYFYFEHKHHFYQTEKKKKTSHDLNASTVSSLKYNDHNRHLILVAVVERWLLLRSKNDGRYRVVVIRRMVFSSGLT